MNTFECINFRSSDKSDFYSKTFESIVKLFRFKITKMYATKTYKTDLELQCSDDVSLFYSKYVLSEKSSYIDAILSSCEPNTNKIYVEYPSDIVTNILLCIDGKKIKKTTMDKKLQMYIMAHKWNIKMIEEGLTYSIIRTINIDQLSLFKQLNNQQYNKAIIQYAINVYRSKDIKSPYEDVIKMLMKIVMYAIYTKTSTLLSHTNDPLIEGIEKIIHKNEENIPEDRVIDTLKQFCGLVYC